MESALWGMSRECFVGRELWPPPATSGGVVAREKISNHKAVSPLPHSP